MFLRGGFLTRWAIPVVGAGLAIGALFRLYLDPDFNRLTAELAAAIERFIDGIGFAVLWRSGVEIRSLAHIGAKADEPA